MRNLGMVIMCIGMLLLSGCFQVETIIRVNRDGSGTVSETMMLSKKMLSQMNAMMEAFPQEGGAKPQTFELYEPDKLKARAKDMGDGVTYLSGKKTDSTDFSGYTATYAFLDINSLRLNQQGESSPSAPGPGNAPSLPVIFHFNKGNPSTLVIEQPMEKANEKISGESSKGAGQNKPADSPGSDNEAKELIEMFMGMKMVLALDIDGEIVETNATHRNGNRITLVEMDLARFGKSIPELEKLKELNLNSVEEAKELIKDIPGMKIDLNRSLKVVFK
jgi:hypothetical protein